ncbi:MAG: hypothetical protein RIC87_11300 [Kiloniellales bacterium]
MSVTTIELYDALRAAGVNEETARTAAKSVLSREEAKDSLVTSSDLERALRTQTMWIAGLFVGQVAVFTGLLALFF